MHSINIYTIFTLQLKTMKKLSLFIAFMLLVVLAFCADTTAVKSNRVDLPMLSDVLPIARVMLNGKPVYMLFDSGSESTVLNTSEATGYGFKYVETGKEAADGVGGTQQLSSAYKAIIDAGGIILSEKINALDLTTTCAALSRRSGKHVVGILGSRFMRDNKLVIDFVTNSIHN